MNQVKIKSTIIIFLIFLCIFPVNCFANRIREEELLDSVAAKESSIKSYYYPHNTTRKQAIIDFVAALQMKDGGFVEWLTESEGAEDLISVKLAVKVLSKLNALNAVNADKIIDFVAKSQCEDGAFTISPRHVGKRESDNVDTSCAAYILYLLNGYDKVDRDAMLNWVLKCYREFDTPYGKYAVFYDDPSQESGGSIDIVYGILTLYWMGELGRVDRDALANALLSYYEEDGTFSGGFLPYETTRRCLEALLYLGALDKFDEEKRERTINYYMSFYNADKGYFDPGVGAPLANAHSPVFVLSLLGGLDRINRSKMIDLVLSCQSPWYGGFAPSLDDIFDESEVSVSSTLGALEILEALDALDVLEENFTVMYRPVWHGEPYVPREEEENGGSKLNLTFTDILVLALSIVMFSAAYVLIRKAVKYRRKFKKSKRSRKHRYIKLR
ncbi:MAG: prenyltransferase/squalene oxidase repeat-containing protein [Candidatus Baldrarchaeia archaeon]